MRVPDDRVGKLSYETWIPVAAVFMNARVGDLGVRPIEQVPGRAKENVSRAGRLVRENDFLDRPVVERRELEGSGEHGGVAPPA